MRLLYVMRIPILSRPFPSEDHPRDRFIAFRRSRPRAPRLSRRTVRARGLEFAVYLSPEVPGATPLVCVNGGLLFDHNLLWPALAPLAERRQLVLLRSAWARRFAGSTRRAHRSHRARRGRPSRDSTRHWLCAMGCARPLVGGGLAMLAAERDRGGVRRLVLVDSVGPVGNWQNDLLRDALPRLGPSDRAILERIDQEALLASDPGVHSAYSRAMYSAWFADASLAEYVLAAAIGKSDRRCGGIAASRRGIRLYRVAPCRFGSHARHSSETADLLPVSVAREYRDDAPERASLKLFLMRATCRSGSHPSCSSPSIESFDSYFVTTSHASSSNWCSALSSPHWQYSLRSRPVVRACIRSTWAEPGFCADCE